MVRAQACLAQQGVAGLLGESLEIAQRTGVCANDFEHLPGHQFSQRFFGFQNWQRTVQATRIQRLVNGWQCGVGHGALGQAGNTPVDR